MTDTPDARELLDALCNARRKKRSSDANRRLWALYAAMATRMAESEPMNADALLRRLVERLEEIHADDRYKAVWISYQIHGGQYVGPKYEDELNAAKAYLSRARTHPDSDAAHRAEYGDMADSVADDNIVAMLAAPAAEAPPCEGNAPCALDECRWPDCEPVAAPAEAPPPGRASDCDRS